MAEILKRAWHGYHFLFNDLADPTTKNWPFVSKPYQGLTVLFLYLMFVYKWGPRYMKNRQPFKLEKLMMIYNLLQVTACAYIFYMSIYYAWGTTYKWVCQPVNYNNDEQAMMERTLVYYYFCLKLIDLIDTVFFVLRKKFNQVSFLHVYHHTGMVMLIWAATTYYPGGHGTLVGVINSFVHVVMYFYYFLTVAFPSFKESIWWKKHITELQILQFFWCVVHMAITVFIPDCGYPRFVAAIFLPQNFFILILFIDFYIKAYIKKPKVKAQVKARENGSSRNGLNEKVKEKVH